MIKNLFKINLLLFFTMLLVSSCRTEIDNTLTTDNHLHVETDLHIKRLKGKSANDAGKLLMKQIANKSQFKILSKGEEYIQIEEGEVDYSEVLEVKDPTGYTNLSFRILNHPKDNYTTFHNVVLTLDSEGKEVAVNIFKYNLSQNSATQYYSTSNARNISGTVQLVSTMCEENPAIPNPVYPFPVDGNGPGGGEPGGPSGPGSSGPGSSGPGSGGPGGGGGSTDCAPQLEVTFVCTDCYRGYSNWDD